MSKKLLEKLEYYEQQAYDKCGGSYWLEQVGQGFTFYVENCIDENTRPTIKGFEKYIDDKAKELKLYSIGGKENG